MSERFTDPAAVSGGEMTDREISLFEIGGTVLRSRWQIALWMLAGGVLLLLPVLFKDLTYTATTSFVPQATDPTPPGLRSLAGQFGLAVGGASSTQSPQFYADLLNSPVILAPIAADTFVVREEGGRRRSFLDLMGVEPMSADRRQERGVKVLMRMTSAKVNRETGVLTLSVTSEWPSVSARIANQLVQGVNGFNLRTRQGQASEERRFTEARLAEARGSLREAENRLQGFLQSNRQVQNSPELSFERDRLQREVGLQQELVTSLAKSYEEVRIREVRDTPVITVIEQASVPTQPNPRGRTKVALLGILLGAFFGVATAVGRRVLQRRRIAGDPDLEGLVGVLGEVRGEIARLSPWRHRRATL
jgi:uncharacterized protein involved in exopolysaccharide biosynthesis